jgi:flagellar assembly protein FliH
MAEAARYMFDRKFDGPVKGVTAIAARKMQEEWERKLADACCTAYEKGRSEGEAEALKSIEEATRAETGVLLDGAKNLLGDVEQECDHIRQRAIELATMTANLLAEELIARMPSINLEVLFTDALEYMGDAPHIALTVNDALAESVQTSVKSIAAERGFTGKIVVLGDPETKKGDCTLQWADGGISLDFEKTKSKISRLVHRHLDRLISQPAQASQAHEPSASPRPDDDAVHTPDLTLQCQSETEPISETPTGPGETK